MPSVQDCAERLREQAHRTLLPQVQDLEQELKSVSGSLLAGLEQIERKLESLRKIELPTADLVLNEILDNLFQNKDLESNALVLFMRGMRQKETQEEILSFLLEGLHLFYPRVALFSVRSGRLIGWSSRGFSESAAHNIGTCSFSCSESPQIESALETEDQTAVPEFAEDNPLQFLREDGIGSWSLLSLKAMQRPVALLLTGGVSNRPDAAAIMTGLAAFRLENIALKILHDLAPWQPVAAPQSEAKGREAAESPLRTESAPASSQPPEKVSEPVAEPAFEQKPAERETSRPEPDIETAPEPDNPTVESVEESLEAEAVTPAETIAPVPLPEAMITQRPEPDAIPEEERLHADAKRFAKLLVSEIKLYNEHHVVEGRNNCDLYLRLKRDIDKSREMYEKRISPAVSQKIDYFHDEIIRILGDNDPSTLGSDYPGPRVES